MEQRVKTYSLLALALVVTWTPDGSLAQEQELSEIHTVALDNRSGVQARRVTLTRSDGSRRQLGPTGSDGVLTLDQTEPCRAGMVLEAVPDDAWYRKASKDVQCHHPEIVELEPIRIQSAYRETDNLLRNIGYVIDDASLSALLYNELAAEVASADQSLSRDYAERAVYAWANATGFSGEPVGPDGGNILTTEFAAHVENLEGTGRLDYEAFATQANHDIFWFRHGVYPEPSTVPTRSQPVQCARLSSSDVINSGESPLVTALVRAAEERASVGEYGNAALLFNEAHARVSDDTMMAVFTEHRVYENAGQALNVPVPVECDPIQQRFVMTPTMVEAVRAQQPTADRPDILGYQTIRTLANIDVGPFLARQPN